MGYLVIERSDGGVTVRSNVPPGDDHQAHVEQWATRARVTSKGWSAVSWFYSEADPRPDREFRNAFVKDGNSISVDPDKAKGLQEDRIKKAKLVKARELLEREVAGENVAVEKAKLRAISEKITGRDLDDIKKWPPGLERPD